VSFMRASVAGQKTGHTSLSYGLTGGRVSEPKVLIQVGCPKPPALIPVPPFGFGVMSKMMLSGRAGSPDTPPTPER